MSALRALQSRSCGGFVGLPNLDRHLEVIEGITGAIADARAWYTVLKASRRIGQRCT